MDVNLHVDLETLQLIQGPGQRSAVSSLRFKRGDAARLRVVFLESGITPVTIGNPSELEIQIGIKPRNQFDHAYLAQSTDWTMPVAGDETPTYECLLGFNTLQLNSALNVGSATVEELPEITLMGEITFREGTGEPTSTRTFIVVVENDVNRGDEGTPLSLPSAEDFLSGRAVRFDVVQMLSSGEKQQALDNLGIDESGATPSETEAAPNTLALRDELGGGVMFGGGCVFTDTRVGGYNVTINSSGASNEFTGDPIALTVSNSAAGKGVEVGTSGNAIGVTINSNTGAAAIMQSLTSTGAVISSYSGTGARISSQVGPHLNVGINKFVVANNGNASFTGNVTAPNLVTNNGANSFAVRPSSSGPVLSSTSLITQADGDVRYGQRNFSGIATNTVSSSDITPIKVASLLLPIGLYYIDSLVSSIHGGGLCTIELQSNQPLGINVIESYGNDQTAHITNPIGADNFASSARSAVTGTTFSRRVAGIVQITKANTELSITYAQFVANATPSTTRKRAYITATKLS